MQNETGVKVRESSIELLRIISMFSIVICHFASHGKFSFSNQTLSVQRFWWHFIEMGGNWGADVFVLISGYFLIENKGPILNLKKLLKFWGQVFFYSIIIYIIFIIVDHQEFSLVSMVKTIFPITFNSWWFASTYFVLYLIHPFINMLLRKLEKATFQKLLILLITIWCIIPTFTFSDFQSNPLIWFVTLYSVAAYVKLYGLNQKLSCKHYVNLWAIFSLLRYLSSVILILIGTKIPYAADHTCAFYGRQSILTFLSALFLFMAFQKMNQKNNKYINLIASAAFGVYLISDSNLVRPFLWQTVFKNAKYQDSLLLIPYSIGVAILVYITCTLIDLLRQQLFEKPFMKLVYNYSENIWKPFASIVNTISKLVFGKYK